MTDSETTDQHDHQTPSYDDINTPVVVLVGAISALATLITIMFVQGMYYHWNNRFIRQRAQEAENLPAVVHIENQKKALEGGDGTISIEKAKEQVIAAYNQ